MTWLLAAIALLEFAALWRERDRNEALVETIVHMRTAYGMQPAPAPRPARAAKAEPEDAALSRAEAPFLEPVIAQILKSRPGLDRRAAEAEARRLLAEA